MEEEDNTYEIAKHIFSYRMQLPNTYSLQLEEETLEIAEQHNISEYINLILTNITMHGIHILYNKKLSELTKDQIAVVIGYINSYGYSVEIQNQKFVFQPLR
jgi:predicted RNase H-related nuclease YkuK (DUF458 family)